MRHSSAARLPVYFIRNRHTWIDYLSSNGYNKAKCADCGLIAMQDKGSLGYFVAENEDHDAYLSCEQLIIKNIIE